MAGKAVSQITQPSRMTSISTTLATPPPEPQQEVMPNKMTLGRVRYPTGTRSLANFAGSLDTSVCSEQDSQAEPSSSTSRMRSHKHHPQSQPLEEAAEAARKAEIERLELELRAKELADAVEQAKRVEEQAKRVESEQRAREAAEAAAILMRNERQQQSNWDAAVRAWEASHEARAEEERRSREAAEGAERQALDAQLRSEQTFQPPRRPQVIQTGLGRTGKVKYTLQPSRNGQDRGRRHEGKGSQPSRQNSSTSAYLASFEERRRQAREERDRDNREGSMQTSGAAGMMQTSGPINIKTGAAPSRARKEKAPAPAAAAATQAELPQGSFRPTPQLQLPPQSTIWRRRRCLYTRQWPGPANCLGLHAMSTVLREILGAHVLSFLYDVPASLAALCHGNRTLRQMVLSNTAVLGSKLRRRIHMNTPLRTDLQRSDCSPGKRYTLLANIGQHRGKSPSEAFARNGVMTTTNIDMGQVLICQA